MANHLVSITRYEEPYASVEKVVDLCRGLSGLRATDKVFIKPNIVFWAKDVPFPKWGVVTTSRVVCDIVHLLADFGVKDITIGEGTVVYDPKDYATPAHAFDYLGYRLLEKHYGVKVYNIFERPFEKIDLGDDVKLNFNKDFLDSDFLVDLPVMKTHAQTVVSLGLKNVKGLIDINSRKKCHSANPDKDLHFWVAKLGLQIPESLTVIDGIFTNERGPGFDGKIRRSDLLVASRDVFSADKVAAKTLGYAPDEVPHFRHYADFANRSSTMDDIDIAGESLDSFSLNLGYTFPYTDDGSLPLPMSKMGISGIAYPKYDLSMCTYCSILTGVVLAGIAQSWTGEAWDGVEVLTGKMMKPTPGKKHTILLGKCMYEANKDHPDIKHAIPVKTCPPNPKSVIQALHDAGINVNDELLNNLTSAPGMYANRYKDKPEFDESLFRIED